MRDRVFYWLAAAIVAPPALVHMGLVDVLCFSRVCPDPSPILRRSFCAHPPLPVMLTGALRSRCFSDSGTCLFITIAPIWIVTCYSRSSDMRHCPLQRG